jgi:hypothetical protein
MLNRKASEVIFMCEVFFDNRERVPYGQIMDKYRGKWVFLVNLEGPALAYDEELGGVAPCDPISAEVLVVSDRAYGGSESGVYQDLKDNPEKYGNISEMDCRTGNILPKNYFLVKEGTSVEQS